MSQATFNGSWTYTIPEAWMLFLFTHAGLISGMYDARDEVMFCFERLHFMFSELNAH